MAEQRKSSHGQAFNFDELIDQQMDTWTDTANWSPARRKLFGSPPPPLAPPKERAAGYTRPDLAQLQEAPAEEEAEDSVRAAFRVFLDGSTFTCHRCQQKVQPKTLKVPPPTVADGRSIFHMYCSPACADVGCASPDHP